MLGFAVLGFATLGYALLGFATLGFAARAVCETQKLFSLLYVKYHLQHKIIFWKKEKKVTFSSNCSKVQRQLNYLAPNDYWEFLALPTYFLSLKFNGSLSLSLSLRIFPFYKASFILAAKKFRKLIFKHMLLPPASLADENWLFLTKKEGIIFCSNDIKE